MQPGEVLGGRDQLCRVASRELVALLGRMQVLEDERELREVVADRPEVAARRADGDRVGELCVEADLVAVAASSAGSTALHVRRRELADDRRRRRVGVVTLQNEPLVVRHLAGADRLGGEAAHVGVESGVMEHLREPLGRHVTWVDDDSGIRHARSLLDQHGLSPDILSP